MKLVHSSSSSQARFAAQVAFFVYDVDGVLVGAVVRCPQEWVIKRSSYFARTFAEAIHHT